MGPDYYIFALYIFILICAILIICRFLFAGVKRRSKILDEKEEKILITYKTLEDAMDEFYDIADEAKAELERKLKKLSEIPDPSEPVLREQRPYAEIIPIYAGGAEPNEMQISQSNEQKKIAFEQLFNEIRIKADAPLPAAHEKVIGLAEQGKSFAEIAKELKITQNEIDLIIGINKTQRPVK